MDKKHSYCPIHALEILYASQDIDGNCSNMFPTFHNQFLRKFYNIVPKSCHVM